MTSQLVLGTPRIPAKPPRRIACDEKRVVGANVLKDPGFEFHAVRAGRVDISFTQVRILRGSPGVHR